MKKKSSRNLIDFVLYTSCYLFQKLKDNYKVIHCIVYSKEAHDFYTEKTDTLSMS